MKIGLMAIATIFLIGSCGNKRKNRVEEEWTNDSLTIKRVFHDGILQSKISFQKDGKTKEGRALFYNQERLIKSVYYKRDKLVGSHIELYDNGNPSLFICHDSYGDTIFIRTYDMAGGILFEAGEIRPHGFFSEGELKDKHILIQHSFVVKPPKTSISLSTFMIQENTRDTLYPLKSAVEYEWIYNYLFKIQEQGTYKHYQTTLIRDSILSKIYRITDSSTKEYKW